jgi:hypothetical protein
MRKIGLVIAAVTLTAGSAMAQDVGTCRGALDEPSGGT